ncbi:MAG: VanZ family protein [Roseburia inulinivorans]
MFFIPLGIYLTMLRRDKSVIFNTLIITLFSILAEIIQFVFSVGVADIDDVILNSIGGVVE